MDRDRVSGAGRISKWYADKRTELLLLLGCAIVTLGAVLMTDAGDSPSKRDTAPPSAATEATSVRYIVTGTAKTAMLTIQSGDGTSQQTADLPLRSKAGLPYLQAALKSGDHAYISAQNQGDTGTITCEIRGGPGGTAILATNSSSGAYAIVTCSARVP